MTETTTPPDTRQLALAAIDEAEKALRWTSNRGSWEPYRNYMTGQRGLVRHQPTEETLGEFTYPADAEHAALWQPRRIQALIDRDRKTLDLHKPDRMSDDSCPCGWESPCPEALAVIEFWLATPLPEITPAFDGDDVYTAISEAFGEGGSHADVQRATDAVLALITGKAAS
jgi:hypothetical protein